MEFVIKTLTMENVLWLQKEMFQKDNAAVEIQGGLLNSASSALQREMVILLK